MRTKRGNDCSESVVGKCLKAVSAIASGTGRALRWQGGLLASPRPSASIRRRTCLRSVRSQVPCSLSVHREVARLCTLPKSHQRWQSPLFASTNLGGLHPDRILACGGVAALASQLPAHRSCTSYTQRSLPRQAPGCAVVSQSAQGRLHQCLHQPRLFSESGVLAAASLTMGEGQSCPATPMRPASQGLAASGRLFFTGCSLLRVIIQIYKNTCISHLPVIRFSHLDALEGTP